MKSILPTPVYVYDSWLLLLSRPNTLPPKYSLLKHSTSTVSVKNLCKNIRNIQAFSRQSQVISLQVSLSGWERERNILRFFLSNQVFLNKNESKYFLLLSIFSSRRFLKALVGSASYLLSLILRICPHARPLLWLKQRRWFEGKH